LKFNDLTARGFCPNSFNRHNRFNDMVRALLSHSPSISTDEKIQTPPPGASSEEHQQRKYNCPGGQARQQNASVFV
jgi:hypothetical protein